MVMTSDILQLVKLIGGKFVKQKGRVSWIRNTNRWNTDCKMLCYRICVMVRMRSRLSGGIAVPSGRLWNLLNYLEKHVAQAQAFRKRDPMLESLDTLICPV